MKTTSVVLATITLLAITSSPSPNPSGGSSLRLVDDKIIIF